MKIRSLHINNVNNIVVRHEFLEKSNFEEIVSFNRRKSILRDTLLDVKIRAKPLFKGVE